MHEPLIAAARAGPPSFQPVPLPLHVMEMIVGHACSTAKPHLLHTCSMLRQMVVQQEQCLTLVVDELGSERSYKEARAVVRRQQEISSLTLKIAVCDSQAQRLLFELSAEPAAAERPCAVKSLLVRAQASFFVGISSWGVLLGAAFPTITTLELRGVHMDTNTLQGLAHCRSLVRLVATGAEVGGDVTHPLVKQCLPSVVRLSISWHSSDLLPALAPQLTCLEVEEELLHLDDVKVLSALAHCLQLKELIGLDVGQARLEVLLTLPNLARVQTNFWGADAGGRRCSWSKLECGVLDGAAHPDGLPMGVDQLCIQALGLQTAATPQDSEEAALALAGMVTASARLVSISRASGFPQLILKIHQSPADQVAECVAASIQGLAALRPFISGGTGRMSCRLWHDDQESLSQGPFDAAFIRALSPVGPYLQELHLSCMSVEADAWPALLEVLPSLRRFAARVATLSDSSIDGLGALCRDPGPSSSLCRVNVSIRTRTGGAASAHKRLVGLFNELDEAGGPVLFGL